MRLGDWLENQRQQLSDDAIAKKDSQATLFGLLSLFEQFPPDQRREAEHVVATWSGTVVTERNAKHVAN